MRLTVVVIPILLSACVTPAITNAVPQCDRLIPLALLEVVPFADMPVSAKLPDGHDDARPWQAGFIEQTGQKEKADARAPAIHHIYKTCLDMHREQLKQDTRGFFARLF